VRGRGLLYHVALRVQPRELRVNLLPRLRSKPLPRQTAPAACAQSAFPRRKRAGLRRKRATHHEPVDERLHLVDVQLSPCRRRLRHRRRGRLFTRRFRPCVVHPPGGESIGSLRARGAGGAARLSVEVLVESPELLVCHDLPQLSCVQCHARRRRGAARGGAGRRGARTVDVEGLLRLVVEELVHPLVPRQRAVAVLVDPSECLRRRCTAERSDLRVRGPPQGAEGQGARGRVRAS